MTVKADFVGIHCPTGTTGDIIVSQQMTIEGTVRATNRWVEVVIAVTITAIHEFGGGPTVYKRIDVDVGIFTLRLDWMVRGVIAVEEQSHS